MAYPEDIRPITVELDIDGAWVDVSSYVLQTEGIAVARGAGAEDNSMPPTVLSLGLNNADGRFNPDDPMSPYWPLLQQNTQIRLVIDADGDRARFTGEVSAWPVQINSVAADSTVQIDAGGLFRRWERGQPLISSLRRSITAANTLVSYHPMEDEGANAQTLASGIPGKPAAAIMSAVDVASYSGFVGSRPVVNIGDTGRVLGAVAAYAMSGNQNVFWLAKGPVDAIDTLAMVIYFHGGSLSAAAILAHTNGDLRIRIYDNDGLSAGTSAYGGTHNINDKDCLIRVIVANSGADVNWRIGVVDQDVVGVETVTSGSFAGQQIGRIRNWKIESTGQPGGHVAVFNGDPTNLDEIALDAFPAYVGETAGARYLRVCRENGVAARMIGDPELTPRMGPQPVGTLRTVLQDCADVDHGIVFESRDELGVTMITRVAMENQATTPAPVGRAMPVVAPSVYLYIIRVDPDEFSYLWEGVTFKLHYDADDSLVESTLFTVTRIYGDLNNNTEIGVAFDPPAAALPTMDMYVRVYRVGRVELDYGAHEISRPFVPVKDDRLVANEVVLTRRGGSEYTARQDTGPRSVLEPPAGIGLYQVPETLNLFSDGQLAEHAEWMLNQGVLDRPRFPNLRLELHRAPLLDRQAELLDADIGHSVVITNAGNAGYYEPVYQIARGYTENYAGNRLHHLVFNTVPGDLYNVLTYDTTGHRWAGAGSTLAQDITSSTTGAVKVAAGAAPWTTTPADFPLDVLVGGERVTVSAVSGTAGNPAFVGTGLSVAGNNASLTPGLPTGAAAGHVVLIAAGIRSLTATVNTPAGWTDLSGGTGQVKVFARTYDGVWTMPTVTFTGSVSGESTIGMSAAFSGIELVDAAGNAGVFDSAGEQDLYVVTQNMARFAGQKALRLALGFKWDDWTGVVVGDGSDLLALDSRSTALGDDAAMVWSYAVDKTSGDYPERTMLWDVTGGGVAVYHSRVYLLPATAQTFTVSARSVNGVVKAHSAGTSVDVADGFHYGL